MGTNSGKPHHMLRAVVTAYVGPVIERYNLKLRQVSFFLLGLNDASTIEHDIC